MILTKQRGFVFQKRLAFYVLTKENNINSFIIAVYNNNPPATKKKQIINNQYPRAETLKICKPSISKYIKLKSAQINLQNW